MLISKKVVELNNHHDRIVDNIRDENNAIYKLLNPINKMRLNRLNSLIYELTKGIEELTGWIYTPYSFTLKSNYKYNPNNQEIEFDLNRVERTEKGYKAVNSKKYENEFIDNYQKLLNRLFAIEQKREELLSPYKESYNNFIINFNSAINHQKRVNGESTELDYLEIASNTFITKFGIDGVIRLVSLLNYLTDNPTKDPLEIYNNQFRGNITNLYVDELFRWSSSFTPKAQFVIDFIEKRKEELDSELTPDLREKIR